jgi:CheY-like chemotaxis protein
MTRGTRLPTGALRRGYHAPASPALAVVPAASGRPAPLARILVSEDDPGIRQLYRTLLPAYGFELMSATGGDGDCTLDLALRCAPQLLITDLHKPGLDGYGLVAALRANQATADIPVLMVTAIDPWADPRRMRLGMADDHLVKPFHCEGLIARIAALLHLPAAGHDRLAARALADPCHEQYHAVTGLPCFHRLAAALPTYTARPGWAALGLQIVDGLHAGGMGRAVARDLLGRLAMAARRVAGGDLLLAHAGFDPLLVLVGPVEGVARAASELPARILALAGLPATPSPQIVLRYVDDRVGLGVSLATLRSALRSIEPQPR